MDHNGQVRVTLPRVADRIELDPDSVLCALRAARPVHRLVRSVVRRHRRKSGAEYIVANWKSHRVIPNCFRGDFRLRATADATIEKGGSDEYERDIIHDSLDPKLFLQRREHPRID